MNPSITQTPVTDGEKNQFANLLADAARKAAGTIVEELSKNGMLISENFHRDVLAKGDKIAATVMTSVKTKVAELVEQTFGVLRRILRDQHIVVAATDGKTTLAKAKDVFVYIDPDFKNYGCDGASAATSEQPVEVYEMMKDADFRTIFGGFGENLDRLCLTQDQIKAFCRDHRDKLRTEGYGTFFLFKVRGEFFVAGVDVHSGGLHVGVGRFSYSDVWSGGGRHRVVLPQL